MASAFSSSDSITENQAALSVDDSIALEDIWNVEQKERCLRWVEENVLQRVALQFPDQLLRFSVQIADELQRAMAENVRIFILGDTSYGSCCVDEIAASHASADGIIHFGHACLSKVVRIPTFYVFFQFKLDAVRFSEALAHEFPDKDSRFTCFYDVGYIHSMNKVKGELLKSFPQMKIATLAKPDEKPDALCWKFVEPLDTDCLAIYVGKDNISFFNTTTAIEATDWYLYDPSMKNTTLEKKNGLGGKWFRRRSYAIERCKDAYTLGIVVATLSTAGYLDIVTRIQRLAMARGIRTYILSIGKVNPEKLANFIDIDCFVLVGCPENDIFTSRDFYRPLLSVFEAELALNPVWRAKQSTNYTTDYNQLLPQGWLYTDIEEVLDEEEHEAMPDVSLITGKARSIKRNIQEESEEMTTNVVSKGNQQMAQITSADHFANRSWQGLQQNLGNDAPARIENGRSGLPIRYENDPEDS